MEGVVPIFDDFIIYGTGETYDEAVEDHDRKLIAFLKRCRERGIKLNKEKLKLRLQEVTFMGHFISGDGLKRDPAKLEAIQKMPTGQKASKMSEESLARPPLTTCRNLPPISLKSLHPLESYLRKATCFSGAKMYTAYVLNRSRISSRKLLCSDTSILTKTSSYNVMFY